MAHFFASRVAKLEARKVKPSVVRGSVVRFTPEGRVLGTVPPRPFMAVTDHGTDAQWQIALLKQQTQLTARP